MLVTCFILLANLCQCMSFSCQGTQRYRVIGNRAFLLRRCHFFFLCCLGGCGLCGLMAARCCTLRSLYRVRAFCTSSCSSSTSSACFRYFCALRRSLPWIYTIESSASKSTASESHCNPSCSIWRALESVFC